MEKPFLPLFIGEINLSRSRLKAARQSMGTASVPGSLDELRSGSLIYGAEIQSVFETINQPLRKFAVLFMGRDETVS